MLYQLYKAKQKNSQTVKITCDYQFLQCFIEYFSKKIKDNVFFRLNFIILFFYINFAPFLKLMFVITKGGGKDQTKP